jgi:hypothetical protein
MHTKIAEFPSKTMYGSMLTTHSSVASHLLRHLPNVAASEEEDAQEILGTPVIYFDTAGCEYFERLEGDSDEGSRCNENEATIVKKWVATLVCCFTSVCSLLWALITHGKPGRDGGQSISNCDNHTVSSANLALILLLTQCTGIKPKFHF